jgi:bifunctional DNase/RNase
MIHMVIDSLRQSLLTKHDLAVLCEADGERCLMLWLPKGEAALLAVKLKKMAHPRPLTYDFFVRMLHQTNLSVERVVFHSVLDGRVRVHIIVAQRGLLGRNRVAVECSPFDALLTAAHFEVPIYAQPAVLDQLGTTRDALPTKEMDDAEWGVKADAAAKEADA